MKRKLKIPFFLFWGKASLLFLILGLVFVGSANALPMLSISDGITTVNITDNVGLDGDSDAGVISYSGIIGAFTTSFSIGITNPAIGDNAFPMMHLSSVQVSGGAGNLEIWFTETDFATPTVPGNYTAFYTEVGGVTAGDVTLTSYYDTGNVAFGTSGTLASLGTFGPGAFSSFAASGDVLDNEFSMTLFAQIHHSGSTFRDVTSFDAEISPVPEPATMFLLGAGLIGIAGVGRKKIFKK